MSNLLDYMRNANHPANVYIENNDADEGTNSPSSDSSSNGGLLAGILERIKEAVTPTVIAPNYQPRALDDSVYADTPGTTTADGDFGQQEDESIRQQRMDDTANYMIENYPRAYGGMLSFDNGVASSIGSIQEGLGLGDSAMQRAADAEKSQKPIWDAWDAKYGDNYFLNPKGLASDIGNAAGSTLPVLALGEVMPEAVVARGVKLGQAGLSRLGLSGLAQKGATKALLGDLARSPIPNAADTLMEYGSVVHDLKQNGYSDEAARNQARPILANNMLLDTVTVPLELSLMKGLKGANSKIFNSYLRDGLGTRIAKGTGRAGVLSVGSGLIEGAQEGAQNALEDQTEGKRESGWWNPLTWTDDDWKAARGGFAGGAFLGIPGGFVQGFHPERPAVNTETGNRLPEEITEDVGARIAANQNTGSAALFGGENLTETGLKTPEDIVGGVALRTANQNTDTSSNLFGTTPEADSNTETGIKTPEDIIAGIRSRATGSANSSSNTNTTNVFSDGGQATATGVSSPEEIISRVQQRQAQEQTTEQQKATISQYLDDNTIEQMGGEDNYNWLMGVLRSGTPDEVQQAYQTVVTSTAATKQQEAEARLQSSLRPVTASASTRSAQPVAANTGNPNVDAVLQAAHDQNFDAGLALAVAAVESGGGDVNEIHMVGNDGMFQIEPDTARNYGVADKYPDWQTDPYQNAMAGIEVLKAKIAEKDGDTWAGVEHYNGGGDPDYLSKVQNAYGNTGAVATTTANGGGASYDGIRLTLPDNDEFTDQSGNVDGLTEDTHLKLRVLDNLCYQKFGQHLIVSSSYREGDPNNHGAGVAFDVSGGIVDNPEARQWLEQAGPAVGLFVIPEYQGEAGAEFAHGDNVHFSNVEPGIYGQTRDAEGHWSEEHAAPSIQSILNGGGSTAAFNTATMKSNWGGNSFTDALRHWEDVVIPDVASQMRDSTPESEDTGIFDGMFATDNGQEHFKDTPENRETVKKQYGQQVQDAAVTAMAENLLRDPSVQQNTTIADNLSSAVKNGDIASMTKVMHHWFDVKTPNLDKEQNQAFTIQTTTPPIGGMHHEASRSTSQDQTNRPEAISNQNVNAVPGQSPETGTGLQAGAHPSAQNENRVTETPSPVETAPTTPALRPIPLSTHDVSMGVTKDSTVAALGNLKRAYIPESRDLVIYHQDVSNREALTVPYQEYMDADDKLGYLKNMPNIGTFVPEEVQATLSKVTGTMQSQTNAKANQNTEDFFTATIQQGRPVINELEVQEDDDNAKAVEELQHKLTDKGEAVFNAADFEAEKKKRGPEYTIQDYAKEWLARKTPGVKRDTATYRALEEEVARQMEAAYQMTQKDTKKAADNGDVKLAGGYRTESGRPLSEADRDEFIILPNGSKNFGAFSSTIASKTKGEVKALPIRLQVGFNRAQDNKNTGFGLLHIKRRELSIQKLGYDSAEDYVQQIAKNYDRIYDVGNGRIILAMHDGKYNVMPIDLEMYENESGYYTIVTAIPKKLKREAKEKGTLIFDRSASLSPVTSNRPVQNGEHSEDAGAMPQSAAEKSNVPSSNFIIAEESKHVNASDRSQSQEAIPNSETKLAQENGKDIQRSKDDLKAEIKEALPTAKDITEDGDRITFTMPNGSRIVVDVKQQIVLDDTALAQAKKDHQMDAADSAVVEGLARVYGKDAYIALSQGSRTGTGFHEVYHIAENAVLTAKEKGAITKAIPNAEDRANRYAKWVEARKQGRGTAWGKLFQKIRDFAEKVRAFLTRKENAHNVFRKVESGKIWNRQALTSKKEASGKTSYSIRKPKTASEKEAERAEQETTKPITIHTILDEARKVVPIYTRSKVQRDSRAGYRYDEHGRAGFVPSNYTVGDIGAAVALHIDHVAQLKGANVELTNDVLDELETEQRAAKKYKQEPPKAMTPAEARSEGIKEFGCIYFQDPARAKERYPKYFAIFEKTLDTMPEEKASVEKMLELEDQMAAQNPLLLATAGIRLADDKKKPKTVKERLKTAWAQFYRAMVDETDPIRQITKSIEMELGKKLADEKDPHKRAVMCNSVASGRAAMLLFADNKAANLSYLNKVYKGAIQYKVTFEDVLNELRKVQSQDLKKAAVKDAETYLGMYLVAQRTEEIVKTHEHYTRPEGYDHENCMRIIAEAPEAIKKAAQLYWDYNKNLVNILEAEGLISAKQAAGLRKYEKYCPMYRDMSADSSFDNELPTITAGRGFINQSSGIKKLKGGSILAVINPIDSMVNMTSALVARCERNDVAKVMVQAAEDHPGLGSIIVKDPSLSKADPSKCAFTVMMAGKKTVYRTTPELYQALQDMSTNSAAFLTNVFGKFTDALRFGATNTPSFMVRNFIRDTISATVNARYGHFIPIVDSIRGVAALKRNADFRAMFYGQGVPMDTYIRSDIRGAKQYKDKVQKSLKRYPMGIRQLMALSRTLVHKYNGIGEALEQGTRAGAMLHAMKAGASDFEAGQEARDVTVNFSRHGSLGKKVNRYVPFFNASIQGTDKLIRTFMENPKRASMATCLYIILPTIILWAVNHDDDWYKELDDNTKYTNWALHIPGTDYHWLIPKPQEVGIGFGSSVEAVLNQMLNKDPQAMKVWARQFAETITPGIIATVLRPIMEWRYNYSEWTGRKLVPDRLAKLPPEQQYTTATSELAKLISQFAGKYAGLSPIAIDNFFSGWFGSLGRMSANALNTPISAVRGQDRPAEPARYWYESPFIGSFARQDGQSSVYVERFYQMAHDMEIDYKRSDSYAKNKGKKGAPVPAALKDARTCMKTMTQINKDIRSIKDDPKMDPESKRQKIDAAYTKMRTYAKKFVTQYDK